MKKLLLATALMAGMGVANYNTAEAKSFDGLYLGLQGGYQNGSVDGTLDLTPLALGTGSRDVDVDGLELGGFAGFRRQLDNNIVLGVELGGLFSNADGSIRDTFAVGDSITVDKNGEMYISFKPGYAVKDNALLYGIVGYQRANFDLSYSDGTNTTSSDDDFDGFHFGFGGEYAKSERISFRAEYKYNDYNDKSYTTTGIGTETYEGDESTFRLGAVFKF